MAPGVLDSDILGLQTLEHIMRVSRTWDSTVSLLPKGGDTIWGNLDWSPEEGHSSDSEKKGIAKLSSSDINFNHSDGTRGLRIKEPAKYGRIISFGKAASQLPSSRLPPPDLKVPFVFTLNVSTLSTNPATKNCLERLMRKVMQIC